MLERPSLKLIISNNHIGLPVPNFVELSYQQKTLIFQVVPVSVGFLGASWTPLEAFSGISGHVCNIFGHRAASEDRPGGLPDPPKSPLVASWAPLGTR